MARNTPLRLPLSPSATLPCLLLFCLITWGCGRGDPDYFGTIRPVHPPEEVWINNSTEPEWMDPGKCSDSSGGELIWNMFAGLTELHPATLEPIPDIAERWELTHEATRFTFHLRKSEWSDGTPLTAHDFEWSWKRVLDPATASKYSIIMAPIKNAAAFSQQALLLTGVPAETTTETVQQWAEQVVPIQKVERSGDGLVFAYLDMTAKPQGGDGQAKADAETKNSETVDPADLRALALEKLPTLPLDGQTIKVQVTDSSIVGVRAVDDYTLVVDLEYPVPYFLNLTGFYTFMPVPRHLIERLEKEGVNPDRWTRPEHLVCNGPYKMVEWEFRQYTIFEQNQRYWNADAPHLFGVKRVKSLIVESYNTSLNMYCAGEMDWTGGSVMIPAEFMDRMRQYKDLRNSRYLGVYFYWFNVTEPPTDNPLVRKALALAVDRQKITEHVTRAGQTPIASVVPDGLGGYSGLDRPLFDPEAARQALADAGYPDGKGLPQITLIYNTSEGHKQIASAIQQMWKKHLGIHVAIENQEWKVYLKRLKDMEFQMSRMGWIGDYADPNTFLELFASTNGNNHSNYADPKYDAMLLAANKLTDPQQRLDKLREAEAYVMEQQPILPIYVYTKSTVVKPYLRGFYNNDMDRHQWKYFSIDKRWYDGKPADIQPDVPAATIPQAPRTN